MARPLKRQCRQKHFNHGHLHRALPAANHEVDTLVWDDPDGQWVALAGFWRVVRVTTRFVSRVPILGLRQQLGQTKAILIFGTALGFLMAVAAGDWSVQRDKSRRLLAQSLRDGEEQFRLLLDGIQNYATS